VFLAAGFEFSLVNPYAQFVAALSKTFRDAKTLPLGQQPSPPRQTPDPKAPTALIFSPHPDDEVIIGGLPLRLLRELRWNVSNVAVTQGSNKARKAERWEELTRCCEYAGFGLIPALHDGGLEDVNLKSRQADPAAWSRSVARIAEIIRSSNPRAVFFPHDDDWNVTHIGTHHLVVDALRSLGNDFKCLAVETEFWGAMRAPNLMAESSERDVVDLLTALSFHVGEVKRNPYHIRMPAWLVDNVRRGGELVGGQGAAAPDFQFATLYRLRRWTGGGFAEIFKGGKFLAATETPAALFDVSGLG
jgi:LmbE family N-acetylglucosaminyl deacetylase